MLKDIKAKLDIFDKELEIIKRDMTILRRIKNSRTRISLVVQWIRIRLPMQATWVQSLLWGDPIPHATEQLSLCVTITEARGPKACALQQETPPK